MDQRRKPTRKEGGLLPLAALSAALLIGVLDAAIPRLAPSGQAASTPAVAPAVTNARADETHATFGPGSRARDPARLPSATPVAARPRRVGGRE